MPGELQKFETWAKTRNGKIALVAGGGGTVALVALRARSKKTGASTADAASQFAPAVAGQPGAAAYDGTLAGSGSSNAAGTGVDLVSQFGSQLASFGSQIAGLVDASNATQEDQINKLTQSTTQQINDLRSSLQQPTVGVAAPGGQQSQAVGSFLSALDSKLKQMAAGGASQADLDAYVRQVAVAGGADPSKLGPVTGYNVNPQAVLPAAATAQAIVSGPQFVSQVAAAPAAAPASVSSFLTALNQKTTQMRASGATAEQVQSYLASVAKAGGAK